ncbi:class I SAM-dependent methyltransferase [Caulobacter sp. SL161]|uniref:class I SAM-dependent methyltransferase n=1 Tax=Caulobacter sp. SL161 TaxID=2995156 RepID=UPI002274A49A|nr:class I SAM-dependent methyltransferase [Caulobacter sp. SL161]MCY1647867.1 class I SAM-dependent methyltransferase [Caulobacter sp. SL161]
MRVLLNTLRTLAPRPIRSVINRLRSSPRGTVAPTSDTPLEPGTIQAPQALWSLVGAADADFVRVGQQFKALFLDAGLKPHHAILDVGCGIGRAAAPLVDYLDDNGRYAGFDVMAEAIDWCRANIAVGDPRFEFLHADMHSDRYNPSGTQPASAYVFPYPDASFDYVWLGSVFTHLLAADQSQFAREIVRVLKPGGISIISWYLIDDEARANTGRGRIAFDFIHPLDGCWTATPDLPEAVIGYDLALIQEQYKGLGLEILNEALGVWRREPTQDQDIIVARKRP